MDSEQIILYVDRILDFYFDEFSKHINDTGIGKYELDSWYFKARILNELVGNESADVNVEELFEIVNEVVNDYEASLMCREKDIMDVDDMGKDYPNKSTYLSFLKKIPSIIEKVQKEEYFKERELILNIDTQNR